jgi:hypothetical protein
MPLRCISVVAILANRRHDDRDDNERRTGSFIYRDGAEKEAVGS